MMLRDALESRTVDQLKNLLALLPTDRRVLRKGDLVALIAEELLEGDLKPIWLELSELDVKAISEAVHAWSGRFDYSRFKVKYGALPTLHEYSPYGYGNRNRQKPRSVLPLFFYDNEIPPDLRARLISLAPPPAVNRIETTPQAALPETFVLKDLEVADYPVWRHSTEPLVRQDLPAVLRLVEAGRVSVGPKTGVASAASLKAIEGVLAGGDWYRPEDDRELQRWAGGPIRPIKPYAWPLLLQTGGLAKIDGSKLALTPKGRKALGEPLESTVKLLFERWQTKGKPDELRRVDLIKGQTSKGARLTAVSGRRDAIAEMLATCPQGEWIQLDQFFRFMQLEGIGFEVSDNPWKLYFADANYGSLGYEGNASFEILQARYALAYLFEYLATLGMIDVVYTLPYHVRGGYGRCWGTDEFAFLSRYDGLLYLRLNALGAFCLGLTDSYVPLVESVPPLLQVHPDATLTLVREPMAAEQLMLEQYAEAQPDGRWRLRLEAAMASAARVDERERLGDFLGQALGGELPVALTRFLALVEERATALRDEGAARLFTCRDAAFAAMLSTDPATAPHCLRAGERLIVVPQAKLNAFQKALTKLGYVLPEILTAS
ncbi:hypothetical protein G3480_16595 [Thiorhodococcus mannitoliphagus]|uniref:Helicase XPB/Ssl2 N-terminal domain-containing protein n=1 Tax=Thiorhodococcus mannitoliphagus TaxID=329406 RepID=A0A6P1DUA5_9GAMM|nr:hypothetical protein [Thiorhodococcus mannitoliphagus]NEX21907.1 hypothetical protein [Thiorhodococcus mannitoliphagus]